MGIAHESPHCKTGARINIKTNSKNHLSIIINLYILYNNGLFIAIQFIVVCVYYVANLLESFRKINKHNLMSTEVGALFLQGKDVNEK